MIPLGIKPFVGFVFKMTFGSPENSIALIGLLNAILELERPITEVTILNPFSRKEFETAKFMVLDVKARDSAGRLFNIFKDRGQGHARSTRKAQRDYDWMLSTAL